MQLENRRVMVFKAPLKSLKELGTALTSLHKEDEFEVEFKNGVLKFIVQK